MFVLGVEVYALSQGEEPTCACLPASNSFLLRRRRPIHHIVSSVPSPTTIEHHPIAGWEGASFFSGLMEEASAHGPIAHTSSSSKKRLGEMTWQWNEEL